MNRNLKIGYVLAFINELYLPIAVWLLFFLNYLDFTQVAIIGALTSITANLFEIPTGAISDLIGRKWTLFLSFIFSSAGLLIVSTGNVFAIFAVGRVVSGIGSSLFSGTHESLMYDSLKSVSKEGEYDRVSSNVETLVWIGLFFAAVSGGFLYDFWNKGPFVITAILYAIAAILCLLLKEPKIDSQTFSLENYMKQNLKGFSELFSNRKIAVISILMITVGSGYIIAAKILGISQAEEYGLSGSGIGILFGAGYIVAAIVSRFYPIVRKLVGNTTLLISATLALLTSFLFAPFVGVIFGSLLIILRISSSTLFNIARSVILNRSIQSKNRATALSTLSLLSQLPFTILFYVIGKYIDTNSPNSFALLLGICLVIVLIPQAFLVKKYLWH